MKLICPKLYKLSARARSKTQISGFLGQQSPQKTKGLQGMKLSLLDANLTLGHFSNKQKLYLRLNEIICFTSVRTDASSFEAVLFCGFSPSGFYCAVFTLKAKLVRIVEVLLGLSSSLDYSCCVLPSFQNKC